MNTLHTTFQDKLGRPEYRHALVESFVRTHVARQIRAMRKARKWNQADLGKKAKKKQSVISRLEQTKYGRLTLQSMLDIARAFDVALKIDLIPFSDFIVERKNWSKENLNAASFEEDDGLIEIFETASGPERTATRATVEIRAGETPKEGQHIQVPNSSPTIIDMCEIVPQSIEATNAEIGV